MLNKKLYKLCLTSLVTLSITSNVSYGAPYDYDKMIINEINERLGPDEPKIDQGLVIIKDKPNVFGGLLTAPSLPLDLEINMPTLKYDFNEAKNARTSFKMATSKTSIGSELYAKELKEYEKDLPITFKHKTFKNKNKSLKYLGQSIGGVQLPDGKYTSAIEVFEHQELGICKYILDDFKTAKAGLTIKESMLRNDINGKYTWIYIAGIDNYGVNLVIEWYDEKLWHTLNCSGINYTENNLTTAIKIGRELDLNNEI